MPPLPIYVMRFDRSFVATSADSLESATSVHAMMQPDKLLGFQALAEGLESNDQPCPRADGVDLGNGFLFARPMTDESIPSAQERQRVEERR
jgi:EAL domain-containing protein (putative c-di-GMP-specific phosphodiesterase class I)